MFVYFGRRYTSTVSRTVARQVRCENCRTVYGYQLTRRASGTGRSAYMLNNQGASRRAKERALAKLDAAIQNGVDLVPCPTCGCFQTDMIRLMRSRTHRWAMPVGLSVALAGGWIAILLMLTLSLTGGQEAALGFAGALSVIGGAGLIFYTRHLRAALDPNADCAARAGRPQVGVFVVSAAGQNGMGRVPLAGAGTISAESILWHYSRNGQVAGPVADSALRAMAARGQLHPSDLVWHEDLPNWVKAGSIEGLFASAAAARQVAQPSPLAYAPQPVQRGGGGGMWVPIIGGGVAVAIVGAILLFALLLYNSVTPATPVVVTPPPFNPPAANPSEANSPAENPPVASPPVASPPVTAPPIASPVVPNPAVTNPPMASAPAPHPAVTYPPIARHPLFAMDPPLNRPPVVSPPVNSHPEGRPAVQSRRTATVGGRGGGPYSRFDSQGRIVVGFQYEIGQWMRQSIVHSLDPIYDRETAAYRSNDGKSGLIVARPGYVVGGIMVDGRNYANAMRIIFMRQNGDHISPNDHYMTDWLGTPVDDHPVQLAGNGERVIGICGRKGLNFDALGLVLAAN